MKRLLACLLALLLALPMFAAAEQQGYAINTSWDIEDAVISNAMESIGVDAGLSQRYAAAVAELMRRAAISVRWQENGIGFAFSLKDSEIANVYVLAENEQLYIRTSVLPDTVIAFPLTSLNLNGVQEALMQLSEPLLAIGNTAAEQFVLWLNTLSMERYDGLVSGDAYSGAFRAVTVHVKAEDMARYLVMTIEAASESLQTLNHTLFNTTISRMLRDPQTWADSVVGLDLDVVLAYGIDDELVGISATLIRSEEPIMTLSMGSQDCVGKLVVGTAVNGQLYYADLVVEQWEATERFDQMTMKLSASIYDASGMGYAAVRKQADRSLMTVGLSANLEADGDTLTWASVQDMAGLGVKMTTEQYGSLTVSQDEFDLNAVTEEYMGEERQLLLRTYTNTTPQPIVPVLGENDQLIQLDKNGNITYADNERINEAAQNGIKTILAKLMRNIPAQFVPLIMQLNNQY